MYYGGRYVRAPLPRRHSDYADLNAFCLFLTLVRALPSLFERQTSLRLASRRAKVGLCAVRSLRLFSMQLCVYAAGA